MKYNAYFKKYRSMAVRSPSQNVDLANVKPVQGHLLHLIASILEDLAQNGDIDESPFATVFDGDSVPRMKVFTYLNHISLWSHCDADTMILALIYVERLTNILTLSSQCIHRLLTISIIQNIEFCFRQQQWQLSSTRRRTAKTSTMRGSGESLWKN